MRVLLRTLTTAFFILCLIAMPAPGQKGLTFLKEFITNEPITIPTNVDHIMVEMWGAGGGGGAYTRAVIPVNPGETIQVVIGKGGLAGNVNFAGGNGGDTQVVRTVPPSSPKGGSTTEVLIFAGGGKGGAAGIQNIITCNSTTLNMGGFGGLADSRAGLKRNGTNGSPGFNPVAGCSTPDNFCLPSMGGRGGDGGTTTVGTIRPPGSFGGLGGEGRTPKTTPCGIRQDNGFPAFPGGNGADGYAIVTY